jgi:MFS family permease
MKPYYPFFMMFPAGISQGFVTVALPYLLKQNGFSVAAIGGIVAIGLSANLWRFLWGPVVDMSLSLKKWYWISLVACTSALLLLCYTPFTQKGVLLLTVLVFVSQVAATFIVMPITAFIAKCVPQNKKGAASGWYQGGSLAGLGLGGGAGLWLSTHYNVHVAGFILCGLSFAFALVLLLVKDVQHDKQGTILQEIKRMGKDIIALVKIPVALFTILLICTPIGSGAASNLWSAIAVDWKTGPDTVALVTGILSGVISTLGCVAGGYIVDRWGVWVGYLGSGGWCAVVTLIMAAMPYNPTVFIAGVLAYTFGLGLINAAFTSVILFAVGKRNVATKYSILASLGNLPVVYMTTFNGWAHDHYNSKIMLAAEAALGFAFIIICIVAIRQMNKRKLLVHVFE